VVAAATLNHQTGRSFVMGIGVSIFFIAVGAILTFAVSTTVSGISISTVGVILMVVGGLGLLWALIAMSAGRRTAYTDAGPPTTVVHDRY
jgi:protein-S-isoprenylcysteine O-methyltransferase Ste14